MRPAPRTIPATGHRLAGTLIALLAVLLALVPADAPLAASGPVPHPASAANPAPAATGAERPDTGPRADDPCAAGCAAQARVRHDHLGERPCPPDHHATDPRDADADPAFGTRGSAPSACVPVSPGRSAHDRGRAPPAAAGT
ncbi:hypothetical protein [Streptomyces rapamycinicus]|uniref:Uncharacterized protein n=2 Tax=Streptomyces rapamycinicus TaxID=1226757 RepID=A0A3L8R7R8_STRRN|nr:hypothetical protein [Streptomyces rapamycinicus]MBB4779629.1 hypothetical protein [Streptomyces rapamycinicus]RLV75711.1 hypothetical protein D3C57_140835 [Streptomyces rapamycinicus NRRL 5491]UTP28378.1 hypothetical protein LIV37_02835 [Streptomyces rapamycinicus NRRL 5491]